ncbi:MAG: hypothetical protein DHS20C15_12680 [Planctomycetota bacterium]|nr:MAG: hypothetical protein DHS20C15_12680 [Planctomycetota bacterium]
MVLSSREAVEALERARLSPLAAFADAHRERPDPESPDAMRTSFTRDRDRVLHSGAFRRLQAKTQVFVIDEGDFYRTRLTHTLEVVQLARYLARCLALNEDLAEVLALVHDIGHPPFGHEGEHALNEISGVAFDHNRQALRIVDLLESPYPDRRGLNLCQLVRRMILKHGGNAERGAAPTRGHVLEAQVADLADSTAYQHHDLEDGLRAGLLRPEELEELSIWRQAREETGAEASNRLGRKTLLNAMLKASLGDILEHTGAALASSRHDNAQAVEDSAETLVGHGAERAAQHRELADFLHARFYRHPRVKRSARLAHDALETLVEHYARHPEQMPADYRERLEHEGSGRTTCDYVAGMTDRFAMDEGQRLAQERSTPVPPAPESMLPRVEALEQRLDYRFTRRELATTALTHASARTQELAPNERLEFLGDAVLGLVIGQELYERFPDEPEGELSRMKSTTVSRHALHRVSSQWELHDLLELGPGFRAPEEVPDSLVANAVEAVLGAVFLDSGLQAARRIILRDFEALLVVAASGQRSSNSKSELQAFTQGERSLTPHYRVVEEDGPDHSKQFTVAVLVGDEELATARGRNKRQAEQRAARIALAALRGEDAPTSNADLDAPPPASARSVAPDTPAESEQRERDG